MICTNATVYVLELTLSSEIVIQFELVIYLQGFYLSLLCLPFPDSDFADGHPLEK